MRIDRRTLTIYMVLLAVLASLLVGTVLGGGLEVITRALSGNGGPSDAGATLPPIQTSTVAATATPSETPVLPTATAEPTSTRMPTVTTEATATIAVTTTVEITPTETVTSTVEVQVVTITVLVAGAINVREAPDPNARVVAGLNQGSTAPVIGRTADNAWLQITVPQLAAPAWVTGADNLVTVSGELSTLPVTSP